MAGIDCFLVGHNEFDNARQKRMLSYLYGRDSHEFRDRAKYTYSEIAVDGRNLGPTGIYDHVRAKGIAAEDSLNIICESFNLAIACLASDLDRAGLSFSHVNDFRSEKDKLSRLLKEGRVGCVAIVTTYYLSHFPIHDIVSFVRRIDPTVKIIVGGPYVTNRIHAGMPQEKISELFEIMGADFVVHDPFGGDLLVEIVRAVKEGRDPAGLRNVYCKRGDSYVCDRSQVVAYDFRDSPVKWDLFRGALPRVANVRTGVSCPFSCAFCNFPAYAGKYTLAPLECVEAELDELHALGVRQVQFVDDTFNVPKTRFKKLLEMMIRKEYGFHWSSYFKCQYVDEDIVALMKESGCAYVFLGIESGSQTILDNMDKHTSVEAYRSCIALFRAYEIMMNCSLIVGFPGETRSTARETAEFLDEARPTFFQQRLWWCDRMAPVYRQGDRFEIEGEGYDWKHATMCSDEAHALADELFLNAAGSIHLTEYPLPFFMLGRGVEREGIESFLRTYMDANRRQYLSGGVVEVTPAEYATFHDALGMQM